MIYGAEILTILATIQVLWTGWLTLKSKELDLKYKNLCKDCEYDFSPKKGKSLPKAS